MGATWDAMAIARRIPHAGRMALLDGLVVWEEDRIVCTASSHPAADHPLRTASGLLAPVLIEYAAQAMALHGALAAEHAEPGDKPRLGFLARTRQVRLFVARLDGLGAPLYVEALREAAQGDTVMYAFRVDAPEGVRVAEGRATVILGAVGPPIHPTANSPSSR